MLLCVIITYYYYFVLACTSSQESWSLQPSECMGAASPDVRLPILRWEPGAVINYCKEPIRLIRKVLLPYEIHPM